MFGKIRSFMTLALCLSVAGSVAASTRGSVSGLNTLDRLYRPSVQGEVVKFAVTVPGAGSNTLTVKVQQQRPGGGWTTLLKRTVKAGRSVSGEYTVKDQFSTGPREMIRYQLSRQIGTKGIKYCLSESSPSKVGVKVQGQKPGVFWMPPKKIVRPWGTVGGKLGGKGRFFSRPRERVRSRLPRRIVSKRPK